MIPLLSESKEVLTQMNLQDGRAMFELQLELHARASGRKPNITADDVLDAHEWLNAHEGDFRSLFAAPKS